MDNLYILMVMLVHSDICLLWFLFLIIKKGQTKPTKNHQPYQL